MNNQVINYFVEFFLRFFGKTPLFFKILSIAGAIAAFIGFLPDIFVWLNIDIPLKWSRGWEITLKIAGLVVAINSAMVTQSKPMAVSENGVILKATNETKLPFTSKVEEKKALKTDLPVVESVPTATSNARGQ